MNHTVLDRGNLKKSTTLEDNHLSFPSSADFFALPSNLISGLSGVSGGRVLLGSKASLQAVSLVNREAPLVQSYAGGKGDDTFVHTFGQELFTVKAEKPGVVVKATNDEVTLRYDNDSHDTVVQLYNHFNMGRKTFIHHQCIVKAGDRVKAGQTLANSNYTDSKGQLALGVNLKTAVMPYRSGNFEDAWVITEAGAKKLEAEQIFKYRLEKRFGVEAGKSKYISLFSNKFTNQQLNNIDEDGCVKVGTKLHHGDPVILAYSPKALKSMDIQLGKLGKVLKNAYRDDTETWHYEHDGEVVDVSKTPELLTVQVKTTRGLSVGDKVSNVFGAKGVCGSIIPNSMAPTDKDGVPVDIMLNSMSITSRVAPALAVSLGMGKLAQKLGRPVKMAHFTEGSSVQKAIDSLKKHGIDDVEELYDPVTGRNINVMVGPMYFTRLVHIAEDKQSSRSQGAGYCFDDETDVLTKRGWLNWNEVIDTDEFLTIKEDQAFFSKASEVVHQDYDGLMYGFEGKQVDYLVTPNHQFWVQKEGQQHFNVIEAAALHKKRGTFLKAGFSLCEQSTQDLVTIPDCQPNEKHFEGVSLDFDLFLKFAGIWLSEGSVVFDKVDGRYRVYVWQDSSVNPSKYETIKTMLDTLPFDWHVHKNSAGVAVGFYTSHAGLAQFVINTFGKYCEDKTIPAWLLHTNNGRRAELLHWLIMGDGWTSQSGDERQYFTKSKKLADSVQQLCLFQGLYASLITKEINSGPFYTLTITNTKTSYVRSQNNKKFKNFYTQDYRGRIHCAVIPDTHLLYVRRNGKAFVSHNSWNMQPAKSDEESSKRVGNLATNALLAHNATAVLRDIATVKGTRNDEFWRRLKLGQPAPMPTVPFIFEKFIASMRGAGIKVDQRGSKFNLLPMTDKDVMAMSKGSIDSPLMFKTKKDQLVAEDGGLFDPVKVGILGNQYNHVDLNFPVPNPISEDYLRKLLGTTKAQFEQLMVNNQLSGKLAAINVTAKIEEYRKYLRSGKKTSRDNAVKVLGFLLMLQKNNLQPKDLMLSKIPVIPAQFRPTINQGDMSLTADINNLYKDLIMTNNTLKGDQDDLPVELVEKLRKQQYEAVKAVYGLGDPVSTKNKEKGIKGLLATSLGIKGGSAKMAMFQSNVVNKPLDLVGRAVLTPDAKLDLDEASVPQDIIWKTYLPFIIRRLVLQGVPATKAAEYVRLRNPIARAAMMAELPHRPAIISRDPSLHKFNLTGFFLKPNPDNKDKTVKLNPLVFKSFNADNDGDQLNINVPAGEDARLEVLNKMLPSKILLSPKNFAPVYMPSNEAALGLYQCSTENDHNPPKKFPNEAAVLEAFRKGQIGPGEVVEIG